jgi:large subunit ribosomal protein L22
MKASLKNYRQAPRKVRLVAHLIKGKKVSVAELELKHLAKRAALPIEKLLASAVANAKIAGMDVENLIVKNVQVNQGLVMKRMMPRAFGRGAPIWKKCCHVFLELAEVGAKKEVKAEKKEKSEKPKAEKKVKTTKAKVAKAKK